MENIDVERLLAGRKAIEEYQIAHAELHHKVQGGKILPIDHSEIMDKMVSGLEALGFESQDAFRDYNGLACGLERVRCYRAEGTCDGCEGRERGCEPGCIEAMAYFDSKSKTYDTQKGDREKRATIEQQSSDGTLTLEKLKSYGTDFFIWRKFPGNVPPGCSHRYVQVVEPRFDIYWQIRVTPIEPEQYEEIKKRWLRRH